ncbi:putative ABC transport system permease protein [Granulicella rosea]|uniref:Putative ABC transport system permease protein n=1 Tax=Granulicella rosea TaxID=474952 RepID=A0A239CZR9_9BACT|nr:ABC transporter permease [Granulicella rosea]SNS25715.1 putative ABC transport system permease protein [Granulicella rosea]
MATASTPKPGTTNFTPKRPLGSESSFDRTLASAKTSIAFVETWRLAVDSFRASKVRFLLTMLGMVIGSASVILVATLGLTGKQYALDQLTSIGPNKIELQYGGGNISGPDNTSTPDYMTREDMNAVVEQVPGIVAYSPMAQLNDNISIGSGITKETMILGVSPQYRIVRNLKVVTGRFFDDQDNAGHQKVTDIVEPFAKELFGSSDAAVGKTITITGIPFTIIGVFKESFDTYGQSEISDHTLLIPYPVARYFTGNDTLKEIFFTMKAPEMVVPASKTILEIVRGRHRATSVYNAQVLTAMLDQLAKIMDMLTVVLTLGSLITLVVSGVGIMNSMLANVQSRTREIGIRKALGATVYEIRLQFLTEAVFLSLAGGVVGTTLGLLIPMLVGLLTPFQVPTSTFGAVMALLCSVAVGVIFGTLPANRAASLDPVETLKYE